MLNRVAPALKNGGHSLLSALVLLGIGTAVPAQAGQDKALYRLTKSVPLGPGEKWDLVTFDPTAGRVYVAHGDHVTVVNVTKGEVVGTVGPISGKTQGIAIVPGGKRGYTDDGKRGVAIPFDLSSLKPIKDITAKPDSDALIYEPVTRHVFVVNADSGSITVIDPVEDKAIATIDIGAGLEAGVADGQGAVYVNGEEKHEILKVDAKTNKVVGRWSMPDCRQPHGLAMDTQARRLFATCVNQTMVVMNADTGATVARVPIGRFSDGAAFDPVRKLAFSSNGDGTLSVIKEIDPQHFELVAKVKTELGARTMAIDSKTGRLFLVGAKVEKETPPKSPGGRPDITYVPGSLQLFYFDPVS